MTKELHTGSIALNRCVIRLDPACTAASPSDRLAIECPTAAVIPRFVSSVMTDSAPDFSGASVTIDTLSNDLLYVSSRDSKPCVLPKILKLNYRILLHVRHFLHGPAHEYTRLGGLLFSPHL